MWRVLYVVTILFIRVSPALIQSGAYILKINGRSIVSYRMRSGINEVKQVQHFLIISTIPLPELPSLPSGVLLGVYTVYVHACMCVCISTC